MRNNTCHVRNPHVAHIPDGGNIRIRTQLYPQVVVNIKVRAALSDELSRRVPCGVYISAPDEEQLKQAADAFATILQEAEDDKARTNAGNDANHRQRQTQTHRAGLDPASSSVVHERIRELAELLYLPSPTNNRPQTHHAPGRWKK